ncbi:MAG: hypothetical protein IKY26_04095 [Erysipelotrichaceae bacterium]|nr:hypothetical protein [Erysipelotrichaceae bacterium]
MQSLQVCDATPFKTLTAPIDGAYVQSMDYDIDHSKWYVLWLKNNVLYLQRYDSTMTNLEDTTTLLNSGHGNSMQYFNGYLYICVYESSNIIKYNVTTKSETLVEVLRGNQVRNFNITTLEGNNVIMAQHRYNGNKICFYCLMPNGQVEFISASEAEYTPSYRNGSKLLTITRDGNIHNLYAECYGNHTLADNSYRGNTISFYAIGNLKPLINVGITNSGREIQDLAITGPTSIIYIINSAGEVFTINPTLFTSSETTGLLTSGTKSEINGWRYTGNLAKMKALCTYDSILSGAATYYVVKEFYLPFRTGTLTGSFGVNGGFKTISVGEPNSTNANTPSYIYVPIEKIHQYNNNTYFVNGYLVYTVTGANITNALGQAQQVLKCTHATGNTLTDVKIAVFNNSGVLTSFDRYRNWADLKTRIDNDHIGFVVGDVYPSLLAENGYTDKYTCIDTGLANELLNTTD